MHHVREPKAGPTHGEQQKALRKEVTKTVAAFMNTSGGTLLIGVADDGDVVGIERDVEELGKMATRDKWEQRLKSCLKTALAADAFQHVRISYALHDDKTVALVSVQSRSKETWLMEGQFEEFYVRLANSSEKLTGSSLVSTSASAGPPDPRDSPASSQRHGLPSYG